MTIQFDPSATLDVYMQAVGAAARQASNDLRLASAETRNAALTAMAAYIRKDSAKILAANADDMTDARAKGLTGAMLDRLALTVDRVEGIAAGLEAIAALPDPVGAVDKSWTQPNGLHFSKVRIPIGVIGMIYESRPNVTADAGGLCVKSGNAVILRGGSESARSNHAIHAALTAGLTEVGLPASAVQLLQTTDRAAVGLLLGGLNNAVDLIIPRGGKNLIARVQSDARVPVLAHLEGLCHSYVHAEAKLTNALDIVENAKLRRTGVCGSTETVIVDAAVADEFIPALTARMDCEFFGDSAAQKLSDKVQAATDENYATEYLAAKLNITVVEDLDGALAHIARFGSGHTDAILTENQAIADRFLAEVDSAICIHNASTQYADGGEFGFGAEIGIATGRLHARGPVGAEHLTTYKYAVRGSGQTRPK